METINAQNTDNGSISSRELSQTLDSCVQIIGEIHLSKKRIKLDIKKVDHQYYGLYNGEHLIIESPRRKILEAMKKDEFSPASNH